MHRLCTDGGYLYCLLSGSNSFPPSALLTQLSLFPSPQSSPRLSLAVGSMHGPLLTTYLDLATAAQDAFSEQEQILDKIEKVPTPAQGTVFRFHSPPSFYGIPAITTSQLSYVPQLLLAPITNSTTVWLPVAQYTRSKRKNGKQRAKNAAWEEEAGTHVSW
jgi:hypothetical protein